MKSPHLGTCEFMLMLQEKTTFNTARDYRETHTLLMSGSVFPGTPGPVGFGRGSRARCSQNRIGLYWMTLRYVYIFLRQQEKKKRGQPCTEVLDQDRILVVRAHLRAEPRRIRSLVSQASFHAFVGKPGASHVLRSPAPGSDRATRRS